MKITAATTSQIQKLKTMLSVTNTVKKIKKAAPVDMLSRHDGHDIDRPLFWFFLWDNLALHRSDRARYQETYNLVVHFIGADVLQPGVIFDACLESHRVDPRS